MFRLKDRKNGDMCLGMTHEEVFTTIARNELRSYKQLPQVWYQIQVKFRDEQRPKSGFMRLRTFIMKDAYSFDIDPEGLDKSFTDQREAYKRIFTRCGIKFSIVEASSGSMGGSQSNEFVARTDAGEDLMASCANCGYAANLEKATSRVEEISDNPTHDARKSFRLRACGRLKISSRFLAALPLIDRLSRWSMWPLLTTNLNPCWRCCVATTSFMKPSWQTVWPQPQSAQLSRKKSAN